MGDKMSKLPLTSDIPPPLYESKRILELFKEKCSELDSKDLIDHGLMCPVCMDLLVEAHMLQKCEHNICYSCADKLLKTNQPKCPLCRTNFKEKHVIPDGLKMQQVQTLPFKCEGLDGDDSVCEWKGSLKEVGKHWKEECKRTVYCKCGQMFFLVDECNQFKKHKLEECKFIRFCNKCNDGDGIYQKDFAEHMQKHLYDEKAKTDMIEYNFTLSVDTNITSYSQKFFDGLIEFNSDSGFYMKINGVKYYKWDYTIFYYDKETFELKNKFDRKLSKFNKNNNSWGWKFNKIDGWTDHPDCIAIMKVKVMGQNNEPEFFKE